MTERRFLFLQGCTSPFFARLGDRLRRAGHRVYRVNFNVGDALYWLGRSAWNFRGSVEELPEFLWEKFETHGFTDVFMLGDTRPVHSVALPIAEAFGARTHVLEEGYFRPSWLTLEEGGINGHSRLPRDPDWYREAGRLVPDYGDGERVQNPLWLLAAHEVAYRVPNVFNPLLFPVYRIHRPHVAAVEFYGWARRFARMPFYERRDNATIERLVKSGEPFYVLPLQLGSDSQIQEHSRFLGIPYLVKRVINSFLRHAPSDAHLVIKNHPLDTGFVDYASWFRRLERRLGLEGRIIYLESGHMPSLLKHAQGVVTVNSTVGPSALLHNCPVIALGSAIYDMPGLTFQDGLAAFWKNGEAPDRQLFRDFRNTVIYATQVNGGLYSRRGIELGTAACVERLQQDCSPLEALLEKTHGSAEVVSLDSKNDPCEQRTRELADGMA